MSTDSLIKLGKTLIEEFQHDDRTDTLSKWMLHYLAELFEKQTTTSSNEEYEKINSEIKEVIFRLWNLRYNLSHKHSHLKNFSALSSVLDQINPENESPFYAAFRRHKKIEAGTEEAEHYFNLALQTDKTAKILISHYLTQAYKGTEARNEELVELLDVLELSESLESKFSAFYNLENRANNDKKRIETKITQLDEMCKLIKEVKEIYQLQLEETVSNKPD